MKKLRQRFLVIFMVGFIYLGIEPLQASQFDKIAEACAALGASWNNAFIDFMYPRENNIDAVKYPEFAKFAKKYRCSREIERQVHEHKDNKTAVLYRPNIQEYHGIPFYNKGNDSNDFDRIINAERTKKIIATHGLDSIGVPDKCLCHMYGNVWNVIAKKVDRSHDRLKISLQEAEQLKTIADQTLYEDFHLGNIIRDDQGKLIIIDTEDRSYADQDRRDDSYENLYEFLKATKPEKDILQWIENQEKLQKVSKSSQQFFANDSEIDFKKAKDDFFRYRYIID